MLSLKLENALGTTQFRILHSNIFFDNANYSIGRSELDKTIWGITYLAYNWVHCGCMTEPISLESK